MAGKTFTGIGVDDLLKESPPLGPDESANDGDEVRGVYSGPTVVDDDKVAEGLQRLRSLESQPEGAPAKPEVVTDMGSSEPTRIGLPAARATAMGRSQGTELPGQQIVVQPEQLRGTMFGHSIHLPNLHAPADGDESPSGPIYEPPRPAASMDLVPYQHRAEAETAPHAHPQDALPFHQRDAFAPEEAPEADTQTVVPFGRKLYTRAALGIASVALIAAVALVWSRFHSSDDEAPAPAPPSAAPAPTATAGRPPGGLGATPPPTVASPTPGPPAAPPVGTVRAPKGTAESTSESPAAAGPSPEENPATQRRGVAHANGRHGTGAGEPGKPTGRKRPPVDLDPDGTLPPSSFE